MNRTPEKWCNDIAPEAAHNNNNNNDNDNDDDDIKISDAQKMRLKLGKSVYHISFRITCGCMIMCTHSKIKAQLFLSLPVLPISSNEYMIVYRWMHAVQRIVYDIHTLSSHPIPSHLIPFASLQNPMTKPNILPSKLYSKCTLMLLLAVFCFRKFMWKLAPNFPRCHSPFFFLDVSYTRALVHFSFIV